ncbi:MAG: hypothetical protein N2253_04865 [Bacteroidia bacterium]|nr:hypothetical protein [Bacteroidia bacterium]MDW8058184.1 glycosyltransferase family 9 protein [Bacteroidia bacterium]
MKEFSLVRLFHQLRWRTKVALRSLLAVGEGVIRFTPSPPKPMEGKGFAFIRLDGIGDFWLWLPFAAALKEAYPEKPFYLIANALWADLATATGLFEKVIPLNPTLIRRSLSYRWRVIKELRGELPPSEVLWQVTFSRRIVVEDWLAWGLPATKRIAWHRDPYTAEPSFLSRWVENRLYDELRADALPPRVHEWNRYSAWLKSLGAPELRWTIYEKVSDCFFAPSPKSYAVVLLGAGSSARLPVAQMWEEIISTLRQKAGLSIHLVGTLSDRKTASTLLREGVEDWTGRLSLVEAVRHVRNASLVVAPETGLGHIAATLGVPTIMIVGGGHWGRFIPYPSDAPPFPLKVVTHFMSCFGCGWMCRYQLSQSLPYPCINRVSPREVHRWLIEWAIPLSEGKAPTQVGGLSEKDSVESSYTPLQKGAE